MKENDLSKKSRLVKKPPTLVPSVIFGLFAVVGWINFGRMLVYVEAGIELPSQEILVNGLLPIIATVFTVYFCKKYISYLESNRL